jgi:Ca-activated chloride channel family protein
MNAAELTNLFQILSWREPLWLLLIFLPVSSWLLYSLIQRKQSAYADSHLMPWLVSHQSIKIWQRLFSKNSAYVMAWVLFGIAAAGPRLPLELATQEQATDMDVMLVVDVSRSMHVTDISPSRLRRAQIEIEEFLERASGSRVGVIVFAARPHLLAPLTSDHTALRFYLRALDTLVLPTHGSEPVTALMLAHKELTNSTNPTAIIMLSDGDFTTIPDSSMTTLKQANIPLYVLGLGNIEGEAIPLDNGEWLQYEGRPVISRLNEKNLRKIANLSGGENVDANQNNYTPALDDDSDWQQLYDKGIARLTISPEEDSADHNIIWQELYHWPLFTALMLLWLSLIPYGLRLYSHLSLPITTHKPFSKTAAITIVKTLAIFSVIILLNLFPQQEVFAINPASLKNDEPINENQAYKNYTNGNYPAALAIYKQLSGYTARLGEGSSHYRMADYKGALHQFNQAILAANNDPERAIAIFNLGNSYFQTGNYAAAVTAYRDVLLYQPEHKKTLHNLTFSSALKKAVDERLQPTNQDIHMGSGPPFAPASDALPTNDNNFLAIIKENENLELETLPLPELADISDATLKALINKGLSQVRLAAEDTTRVKQADYKRNKLAFINAQLRMAELEDQQVLLWKQLFEMEEGFPAPLTEPRQIPGIAPW